MIDTSSEVSLVRQCQLLNLNRSTLYYEAVAISEENLLLMRMMDELHLERPHLGSRQMTLRLEDKGYSVNRKRVQRLMRLMGIEAIYPRLRTSLGNKAHTIYPYLLKDLVIEGANQVWVSDITYLPMHKGFCYLVAIMDLYSRKILSWRLSNTLDTRFCIEALREALSLYPRPGIFNTDQGAQFTSTDFTHILKDNDIQISMDSKGRWIDNVFIERFWRSLKYEEVYLRAYQSISEAKHHISNDIQDYNQYRSHASLDKQTPDKVYYDSMKTLMPANSLEPATAFTPRPCS
jgi:putative transposase